MSIEKLFGEFYKEEPVTYSERAPSPVLHPRRRRMLPHLRLPKIPPKLIFFSALVLGVFYLMHLGYQAIPREFPLEIRSAKSLGKNTLAAYTFSEKPKLIANTPVINQFMATFVRVVTGHVKDGVTVTLITPRKNEIAFELINPPSGSSKKLTIVKKASAKEPEVNELAKNISLTQEADGVGIALPALEDVSGAPRGRYVAHVSWVKEGITYSSDYAFSWGVLVMNTEKDRYEMGELVRVGVGMVDDRGYTICEGDVTATITSPLGKKVTLRTPKKGSNGAQGTNGKNGELGKLTEEQAASLAFVTGGDSSYIAFSKDCADRSVTDNPDYSFQFTVPEKGDYTIDLSATTVNGTEKLTQQFEVVENNSFAIARSASMRIYPLEDYQMRISLMTKEDYTGKVVETVPQEFGIAGCGGCYVAEKGDKKTLTWNVTLSPNVPQMLTYTYNPPDVSPALFFTGPLTAGERKEERAWAIAFDAVVPQVTLTQRAYIFEDDDGVNVNSNTDIAAANTAITDVKPGERINVRFQVDNTSANTFFNPQFELFYDRSDNIWTRVEASGSAAIVPGTGNCTDTNFDCYTLDDPSNVIGWYTDVAVDQAGVPWVSYYDDTNDALKVAKFVGSGGGGCEGSSQWTCTVVDDPTNLVGAYNSIAIDASGSAWISYYDDTNDALKIARYVGTGGGGCTNATSSTAWACTSIENTASDIGKFSAIAIDANNTPWVTYTDTTASSIKAATFVGSGGNCTSNQWNCSTVNDPADGVTGTNSIAIDASGNPWISYVLGSTGSLAVAKYVGSGGSCSNAVWACTTVDNVWQKSYTSIAFDPSGNAWISYIDLATGTAWIARYVGSGGNCTSAEWNCYAIYTTGPNKIGAGIEIAMDPTGSPSTTFVEYNSDFSVSTEVLARYVGSGGTGCTDTSLWTCTNLATVSVVNTSPAIAFDPSGNTWLPVAGTNSLSMMQLKRGGEIIAGHGLSGANGDGLTATAAGSCTGGTSFVTGVWTQGVNIASSSAKLGNMASNKCTEISFMIDTSRAIAGTTYRLRLHNQSPGYNIGLNTYSESPTFTIASSNTLVASKDNQYAMTNCTDTTWGCANVTSSAQNLIMQQHNIVFDASGSAWISSFDNWNGDLVVSRYVGSGGTGCTNSTAWYCQTVDHSASNSKGEMNSIGVSPTGKVWVSYYDRVNAALEVAEYVGSGGSGCKTGVTDWLCYDVDTWGTDTGGYTSIAFDASGNPWISNFGDGQVLRMAKYVGSNGTGCVALTTWTCYTIDTNTSVGRYTTLKFDQNGDPWVSYTDQSGNNAIKIAQYIGSGGGSAAGCGTNSSTEWRCETIDDQTNTLGQSDVRLAIDNNNVPWVSYHDLIAGDLWVAKLVGSGGTGCTSSTYSGKWSCTKVDATNSVGFYNSIAIGPDNKPWISYYDATATSLLVAKYVGDGAGGAGCAGISHTDWICTSVDNTGTTGQWTAMAFDPSGVPWIAETDATAANTELSVAKLHYPYFDNQNRYSLDNLGYTAITSDDQTFDSMAATTNVPIYRMSTRYGSAGSTPTVTWKGKSSVAASTNNILLQAYRFGSTNAWETLTTNSSCGANLGCTVIGTPAGTLSEYFEADGSNYWVHYRTYQVAGTSKTLQTGYFSAAFIPTKIVFTTGQRNVNSGVCSGASVPFTIALQDSGGGASPPSGTTVVQVTSDSSSYAIYSDSSCSTAISGGDITFTTSDSSKTFYLIDSVRGTHVITATKTSGPESLTSASQYQNTDTAGGDTSSTSVQGGVNFRGGSTLR